MKQNTGTQTEREREKRRKKLNGKRMRNAFISVFQYMYAYE